MQFPYGRKYTWRGHNALGDLTGIQKITLEGDRLVLTPIDYIPKLKGAKFIVKDWVTYMSDKEKDKIKKEIK